jgi:PAS domain S-box-containing protein
MHEVSCRAFGFFEGAAQEMGFDPADLLGGTPLTLERLREPTGRVDWEDWVSVCERFEKIVGGPEEVVRWGRTIPRRPLAASIKTVATQFLSVEQIYDSAARWFGPLHYRSHRWRAEPLGGGRMRVTVELLPGLRGSAAWLRIIQGALEAAPTFIGLPNAELSAEITPRGGVYTIVLPPALPAYERARRLARRLLSSATAVDELSALQAQVTENHDALLRTEQDFRAILDRLPDAVAILQQGHVVFANPALRSQLGEVGPGDLVGRTLQDLVVPGDHGLASDLVAEGVDPGRRFLLRLRRSDAQAVVVEASPLVAIRFSGEPAQLFVARDVTEQHAAESALRESEATSRALLEALPHIVLRISRAGRISACSAGSLLAAPLRAEDFVGRTVDELLAVVPTLAAEHIATGRALMDQVLGDGSPRMFELDLTMLAGPLAYECEVTRLDEDQVLVIVRDVTERRRMASQLAMTDRLASLGTLAAGMAHEINNPLTYVLSNIDVIRQATGEAHSLAGGDLLLVHEAAREAFSGAERVRHIVRDLRTFTRAPTDAPSARMDVQEVLAGAVNIVSNQIRHRARLVRHFGPVAPVRGSEARLGQVFLNLLVNAAHAIPVGAAEGNEIGVATLTDANGNVVIEVSDTGPGIPPEVRERIFDPFFSTKPNSVGTGLGLTICHDIVHRMGGHIELSTDLGKGTTFRVVLPPAPPSHSVAPGDPGPLSMPRRRGRILIVDDEPAVARALARLVRTHEVQVARDGADALRLIAEDPRWDVIFCDLMMPNVSGVEFYEQLRTRHPELLGRLAFMTGGAFTDRARELLIVSAVPRLDKPFDAATVHAVVQRLLSEQPPSRGQAAGQEP